jgi:hypothetical protein
LLNKALNWGCADECNAAAREHTRRRADRRAARRRDTDDVIDGRQPLLAAYDETIKELRAN